MILPNKRWLCAGTSPSLPAQLDRLNPYMPYTLDYTATMNGGVHYLPHPDVYGIFEVEAVDLYRRHIGSMVIQGTQVWCRKAQREKLGIELVNYFDPMDYIAERYRITKGKRPKKTLSMAPSGAIIPYILCKEHKPSEIHFIGYGGYAPDALYAANIKHASHGVELNKAWCDGCNQKLSRHLSAVTNGNPDVKFYLYGETLLPGVDGWRVERV